MVMVKLCPVHQLNKVVQLNSYLSFQVLVIRRYLYIQGAREKVKYVSISITSFEIFKENFI
jgi:hypothetical protein